MEKRTLIVGLGNDILTDDAVGLKVAGILKEKLPADIVKVEEFSVGGWDLLEMMKDYPRAILIDSIKTQDGRAGQIHKLTLEDLKPTYHITNPHRLNFITIIELGRKQGYNIPEVLIYAIEVEDNTTFSEKCTPEVEKAIPKIVNTILNENFERVIT
ncbi:hydrogenase maturation protease [bacterium]|nr:hydrogenase maturation protease [bacterium]